jgi:hypothetical protein
MFLIVFFGSPGHAGESLHVSEFKSCDEERRNPHLKFELNVI